MLLQLLHLGLLHSPFMHNQLLLLGLHSLHVSHILVKISQQFGPQRSGLYFQLVLLILLCLAYGHIGTVLVPSLFELSHLVLLDLCFEVISDGTILHFELVGV